MLFPLLFSIAIGAASNEPVILAEDKAMIRLRVSDYDLSIVGDRKRLRRNIARAAGKVCSVSLPGASQLEIFACERASIADADLQLNDLAKRPSVEATFVSIVVASAGNSERFSK